MSKLSNVMDIEHLSKGEDYSRLRKSFVIFICREKISDEYTLPIYTFRYRSEEDPDVYLGDETWTVYVNAHCREQGLSPEIREFLDFIRTGSASDSRDSLAGRLRHVIDEAKKSRKWSVEYMRWEDELRHREFVLKEKIEAEKQRADAEKQRANAAERRADSAQAENARLKELLKAHNIDF